MQCKVTTHTSTVIIRDTLSELSNNMEGDLRPLQGLKALLCRCNRRATSYGDARTSARGRMVAAAVLHSLLERILWYLNSLDM